MRIKSMPKFIFFLTILFIIISCITNMFLNKVFSHEEAKYKYITVCHGETLWSIASDLKGNINENIYNIKKLKGFSDQKSTEKLINTIEKKIDSGSFLSWNESLNKL